MLVGGVGLVDIVALRCQVVAAIGGDRFQSFCEAGGEGVDVPVGRPRVGDVEAHGVVSAGGDAEGVPPWPQHGGLVVAGLAQEVGGGGRAGCLADVGGDLSEGALGDGEERLLGLAQHAGAGGVLFNTEGQSAGRVGGEVEDVGVAAVQGGRGTGGRGAHGVAGGHSPTCRGCGRVGFEGGGRVVGSFVGGTRDRMCDVGCCLGHGRFGGRVEFRIRLVGGMGSCWCKEGGSREAHRGEGPGSCAARAPVFRGVHGGSPLGE